MSDPTFLEVVDEIHAKWVFGEINDVQFREGVAAEVEREISEGGTE